MWADLDKSINQWFGMLKMANYFNQCGCQVKTTFRQKKQPEFYHFN